MIKCLRLFIFVVLFIVACGQTPAEATATPTLLPEPILVAEATLTQVVPTAEPTAEPTPTATAKPTAEPTLTATPVAAPEAVVAWLQTNAVAFDTEQPGSGCDNLQPLLAMIGEARIVALGEATHGTSEFFKMKHRIVECLIVEKGFNLFLIEDYWIEANQINQYVQTGEGDARQLLQGLGNIIWHTEEILHLIQWLQQYNESNDTLSPLAFRGFDMSQVHNVLTALLDYVDETDPESLPFVESEMQCYRENYLNHNFVQGPLRLTETQFQRFGSLRHFYTDGLSFA